ncbi:MAG: hypothetical protein ACUVWP_06925 [bacterium]
MILNFDTTSDILYFNLVINEDWVVQNIAAISYEWSGKRQRRFLTFDLGVDDGTDVSELEYAFSLTKDVLTVQPDKFQTVDVSNYEVIFYSGLPEEPVDLFKMGLIFGGYISDYYVQD